MHDEQAVEAIERIERAIERIERAAERSAAGQAAGGELVRLRAAHGQLRDRVRGAIGEIDRLLETRGEANA